MRLHELAPAPGSTASKVRVGRGRAGRRGKTAGRGTKGAKARGQIARNYEGGQIPLQMRVPKLGGFKRHGRIEYAAVNLDTLDTLDVSGGGSTIDPDLLRSRGIVPKKGAVKVLGRGDVTKALTVRANAFSATAKSKIEAAGGRAETL
jgi:large subunit ribosomal protein L15